MATVPYRRPSSANAAEPLDKPLPNNIDAERSILGAILLDEATPNAALKAATDQVTPSDFFYEHHACIFRHALKMADAKQAIDTISMSDHLHNAGELEKCGGAAYIAQLIDGVPRVSNIAHYAAIVREKSRLRQIIHGTHAVQQAALEGDRSAATLIDDLEGQFQSIVRDRGAKLVSVDVRDFLTMELPPLTYVIDPLLTERGLSMIYSRRGAGKTYVAMQIAYSVACGRPCFGWEPPCARRVHYIDGEMHGAMLQQRQQEIFTINGGVLPDAGMLNLITRDLQKDVRPKINTSDGRRRIEDLLATGDLLLLDNLSALSPSSDEKETEEWASIQEWSIDLAWHGVSILFVHHAGKSGDQRGSSKREDLLDGVLKLGVPSDYNPGEGLRVEVHFAKMRGKPPKPPFGQPFELRLGSDEYGKPTWIIRQLKELLRERAKQMLLEGMRPNDIALETGMSRFSVYRLQRAIKQPGEETRNPE
jgi:hypothetical protein